MAPASLVLLALVGCGGSSERSDAASLAESLWSARVPYAGDSSRVTALVDEIGFGAAGHEVELRTAEPPYALTVSLQEPGGPIDQTDVSGQATLLLGLVANLDEVSISAGQDRYTVTADAASRQLGHDVKDLGRDQPTLVRYLERTDD